MAPLKQGRFVFNPESISKIRNKLGLTQEQLAQKLGVAKTAISRWEKGIVKPDADSLAAIYSVAIVNRIEPMFFKEAESHSKQGRSRLVVAWDFQNLSIAWHEVAEKGNWIKWELVKRFPTISYSLYKVFASPLYSAATDELSKIGWRKQEYSHDIDEELDSQSWSDCNQDPKDTIFVIITRDGDFVDLLQDLKVKGVRVYLMAPENSSQRLIEAVGKKGWIRLPEHEFPVQGMKNLPTIS